MGSSVGTRMVVGKVIGTASLIAVPLPFTPRKVVLYNITDVSMLVWTATMAQDSGVKTITAGTVSVITADGISTVDQLELDDEASPGRGFTIGTDSDLNAASDIIHYVAYE